METYLLVGILIILSGLFSGLNLGLLSLSKSDLKRKVKLNDSDAKKIYHVRKNGNMLLTTLLLGNVIVNSIMSVFLSSIAGGLMAVIISTSLITVFGEIIPQALFSRYPEKLSIKLLWLVRLFTFILYPISKVISLILDKVLGEELPNVMKKDEIVEIIKEHEDSPDCNIDADEERIILGALSYSDKTASYIMTPKSVIFSLDEDDVVDLELLNKIKNKGFSRIPVYSNDSERITGILYTKSLIDVNPNNLDMVSKHSINNLLRVYDDIKLDVLLNNFVKNENHLAFVYDRNKSFLGIITFEDILEEILKVQIVDEHDNIVDMREYAQEQGPKDIIS